MKRALSDLKVAIVHDWLTGMRGGERCLEVFAELFPDAHLYTLIHDRGSVTATIESLRIRTSPLHWMPGVERYYRHLLPAFPAALAAWRLTGYDLVLSSSHCIAKNVRVGRTTPHVCYCYTPVRYLWDLFDDYFPREKVGATRHAAASLVRGFFTRWDRAAAGRVDRFIAISEFVADRIRRHYGRRSHVIYPPVDCSRFRPASDVDDYYLVVSAMAPYKRVDLVVEAMNLLGRRLIVVGSGQEQNRIRALAGATVTFPGALTDEEIAALYARARAFIFPGVEDFGITPLESQAAGRPVIAFAEGGALETVIGLEDPEGRAPTGLFFAEQTPAALAEAVLDFERHEGDFDPATARENALHFDRAVFKEHIADFAAKTGGL